MKSIVYVVVALFGVGLSASAASAEGTSQTLAVTTPPASAATCDPPASSMQSSNRPADAPPQVDASGVNLQPAYPPTALHLKEEGSVVIQATVRDDGTVRRVGLAQSSGYADLDSAAANAVMGWKFLPAMKGGEPTSGKTLVRITFQPPAT